MKKRTPLEHQVDEEIIAEGKHVLKHVDWSQSLQVPSKPLHKLISIRLSIDMIQQLHHAADRKGHIGYQQVIKAYVAEGLARDVTGYILTSPEQQAVNAPVRYNQATIQFRVSESVAVYSPQNWILSKDPSEKDLIVQEAH